MLLGISEKYFKKKKESAFIMRKQTKLVAVLSTAALLALGASMSSFAATGWQEENGTWVYYDKNGDKETEKWEKSGDNWFYLNEDGEMATDAIVEYNDNYYYVDENGSMVANKWVSVENSDYGDDDTEPANHWYYFGANGKAYKSTANGNTASFKTINGKKYIFDEEGKMLYGWIDENGQRRTDDDAWLGDGTQGGLYYCGTENDGAQTIGWVLLHIKDEAWQTAEVKGSSDNTFNDEEQDRWFYFKGNGKKMADKKGETINGKKYSFDVDGRMNAEWVNFKYQPTTSEASQSNAKYISEFRFFGSPEDGARVTKGWFQVVPDSYVNKGDYNDDSENWYYADKDGKLVAGELKTINGKKYAFGNDGVMMDGYRFLKLGDDNRTIEDTIKKDSDRKPSADKRLEDYDDFKFDTTDGFKAHASSWENDGYSLYYFGSGDDGVMKTNKQTVSIDGDTHTFLFNKSGGSKGAGKTGLDNKKYYQSGMLMAADKDDKYAVLEIHSTGSKVNYIKFINTDDFVTKVTKGLTNNPTDKLSENYNLSSVVDDKDGVKFRLVNTSGSVQSNKNKVKDGDDRCFEVDKSGKIVRYFVES
jgi:glucan-binding YG repeat protein